MSTRRAILRTVRRCTAWLAVGFVITITVSWGLAAWMPQNDWDQRLLWYNAHQWDERLYVEEFNSLGCTRRAWSASPLPELVIDFSGPRTERSVRVDIENRHGKPLSWGKLPLLINEWRALRHWPFAFPTTGAEHAVGWPCRALWYELAGHQTFFSNHTFYGPLNQVLGGIPLHKPSANSLGPQPDRVHALPYRLIWPGLAFDSVFWGAAAFAVLRGPRTVRHTLRRRRGQCPACAYPVGASPVCTECGAAVVARQVAA